MTLSDLYFMREWIAVYEGEPDDENSRAQIRILEWCVREIRARERTAAVRIIAKEHGVSTAHVNRAFKRTKGPTK